MQIHAWFPNDCMFIQQHVFFDIREPPDSRLQSRLPHSFCSVDNHAKLDKLASVIVVLCFLLTLIWRNFTEAGNYHSNSQSNTWTQN